MSARDFFSDSDRQAIRAAIADAENTTSGEIRLHVESRCKADVLDRAAGVFEVLGMHKTALRNGVLFYLATEDRQFAILGDGGINAVVPNDFWDGVRDTVIKDWLRVTPSRVSLRASAWPETNWPNISPWRRTTSSNCRTTSASGHEEGTFPPAGGRPPVGWI